MYSTRRWSFFLSVLVMFTLLLSTGLVMAQDGAADSGSSGLVTALRHTHSLVRWLVIIVAIVALVKLVMGLYKRPHMMP